jgi:PAS domain S-box-containing protein
MAGSSKTKQQLLAEIAGLKNRLAECEDTLEAIRTGAVDALVVSGTGGEKIFTLQSIDYSYRVMAENINEGAVTIDNEGIIVFANKAFSDLTGREMPTIVGARFSDYLSISLPGGISDFLQDCTVRSCHGDFSITCAKGGATPVSIAGTSFKIDGRRNVCLIIHDLRERKEAEARLQHAYEDVEQKVVERTLELRQSEEHLQHNVQQLTAVNRELGSFNLSLTHDLRNPLHAIVSCMSLLSNSRKGMCEDERKAVDYINQMTERMSQVINDLLSLSHISTVDMTLTTVLLSTMAQDLIGDLKASDPRNQAEVIIMPGLTASADKPMVSILLANLLGNAWKFSSKCNGARIGFGTTHARGQLVYFVRDNGVGFDSASAGLLFEPFTRFHSREEFPGSGIGLAIVKRIVSRHGGAVWAESEPGKGATFYFTLSADVRNTI